LLDCLLVFLDDLAEQLLVVAAIEIVRLETRVLPDGSQHDVARNIAVLSEVGVEQPSVDRFELLLAEFRGGLRDEMGRNRLGRRTLIALPYSEARVGLLLCAA
jgi:hypothetical protein